jgi:hypothetical protein
MRDFLCPNCGQHLAFENSVCLSCGSALGFSLDDMALLVITSGQDSEHGGTVDANQYCVPISMWPNAIGWSR